MRILDAQTASAYLRTVGMKIGEWNELCQASGRRYDEQHGLKYQAPRGGRELHNFAQHIATWLPSGEWKLFQIDNSTSPTDDEAFLIKRVLFCSNDHGPLPFTLLFEMQRSSEKEELLLSNLIYLFLLFECHGELVSSRCCNGRYLSLQDGFVYFMSWNDNDIAEARILLRRFEERPLRAVGYFED